MESAKRSVAARKKAQEIVITLIETPSVTAKELATMVRIIYSMNEGLQISD